MTDEREHRQHPTSPRVEEIREGEAVVVFTPATARGRSSTGQTRSAVAALPAVCPRDGRRWQVELVGDASQDSGLRAVWADPPVDGSRESGRHDS